MENGDHDEQQPAALIAGLDIRCWRVRPPWGGLAAGGDSTARVETRGGLAGGGSSHFIPSASGGLGGGGRSRSQVTGGGLKAGPDRGGLGGGGLAHSRPIGGGGLLGGIGTFSVGGPIAVIQHANNIGGGSTNFNISVTWPAATTAGNLLIAVQSSICPSNSTSPTHTAPAGWVKAVEETRPFQTITIWYKENAASQTSTGNFNTTALASANAIVNVAEYSNIKTSGSLDKTGVSQAFSGSPATAATGTLGQAKELIVAGIGNNNTVHYTAPTNGYTIRDQRDNTLNLVSGILDLIVSSTASTSTGVTNGGGAWVTAISTFKGN